MKNLKKVLALVLAFACAFTMFAGAAFTDSADIQQTEAVDMLSALGVINGYKDGSFKPNDTISRAEAAKMIYTIWNGGNDNASAFEGKSIFTDVYSGHWAEGYINFCYTNGIINGKGNSKFAPDDKVTGTELAKMLLICMGYQADKSGLTGTGYTQRTNALATQNGLYVDVSSSVTAAMPRQYAAQIMYNALKADTVKWSTDIGDYEKVKTTGYVWMPGKDGAPGNWVTTQVNETMGAKCMSLVTAEGYRLDKVEKEDGRDTYALNGGEFTRVANDYSNLIGQNVNIMYKDGDKSKVYGVYAHEDSKVVATGYTSQIEKDGDKIKLNGTSYKSEAADQSVYSINKDTDASMKLSDLYTASAKGTVNAATAATEIKLLDNDGNGKVDSAYATPAMVAKVTAVSKTAINVRNLDNGTVSTIKFDDADVYEGVAKDDYVTVVKGENLSSGNDLVTKLDVVSAKAEATRGTPDEVRVDGTWYKLAKENGSLISVTTGNSYDFVMIGGVVVAADETAASASSIAYISGIEKANSGDKADDNTKANKLETSLGETTGTVKVRMFFQDGTDKEVKVSKLDGKKIKTVADADYAGKDQLKARTMYTYAELSDGTYDVKEVGASNKVGMDYAATTIATGSTVYNDQKISKTSVADDAIVFVQTGNETKVLTGKQINNWGDTVAPNFAAGTQMLTKNTNGIKYVKYAVLSSTDAENVPGATEDRSYAYLLSNPSKETVDGETKGAYEVWTGTEKTTLHVDASSASVGVAGDVISYATNGKFIEDVKVVGHQGANLAASTGMSFILGVDGDNLRFIGNDGVESTYEFSSDCTFIAINDDKTEGAADIEATMANISYPATEVVIGGTTYYVPNAYVVYDPADSNKIVAVIYDADDGKLNVPTDVNTYLVNKALY
ncbi:S-layer homology domain-containing protein [Agathobaculum sp. LCP25S3_E8]|uniref:S-layer homology domain-containing protein n=1 Tax=Agathobaculum sp. LCP25S3_E8 TaxID=3438735 RepID=UPI003F923156